MVALGRLSESECRQQKDGQSGMFYLEVIVLGRPIDLQYFPSADVVATFGEG